MNHKLNTAKQFSKEAWGSTGPSLLFGCGIGFAWFLLFGDLILGPLVALILSIFHWVDHNIKTKPQAISAQKSLFKKNWEILEDDGGAHSVSIYRGLGKAYEGYYLHKRTLNLID